MSRKNAIPCRSYGYCRVASKVQELSPAEIKWMTCWSKLCRTYCDRNKVTLLHINQDSFDCEMPSGEIRNIRAIDLPVMMAQEKPHWRLALDTPRPNNFHML